MAEVPHILAHALMITMFVFVMIMLAGYFNVLTKDHMSEVIIGAASGCPGAFLFILGL